MRDFSRKIAIVDSFSPKTSHAPFFFNLISTGPGNVELEKHISHISCSLDSQHTHPTDEPPENPCKICLDFSSFDPG